LVLALVGGRGGREKGKRMNEVQIIYTHVNTKMIPVETVPGIGGRGMKESSGGINSSMIYLIPIKRRPIDLSKNIHGMM
jgi:hypothetical protein